MVAGVASTNGTSGGWWRIDRRKLASGTGWLGDKLVGPLIVGGILAAFGIWASPYIAARIQPPTCENPKELVLAHPSGAGGEAKPDDDFARRGRVTYAASNLIDGNTSTAWVEGLPGMGIGAQVRIQFDQPVDVQMVCLVDGYAESWDLYKRNSRVRLLTASSDQGSREALLTDAATPDRPAVYQPVNVPTGETTSLTLTIDSAYAAQRDTATTQAYPDTSISEVEVWVTH